VVKHPRNNECGSPQDTWVSVSQRAPYANLGISGTAWEVDHKTYSYDIIMRFIGLAQQHFTGVDGMIYIQKILDGEATGIPVDTKHYAGRSTNSETQRLSAASSAIARWHHWHTRSDTSALVSLEVDKSPEVQKAPEAPATPPTARAPRRPRQLKKPNTKSDGVDASATKPNSKAPHQSNTYYPPYYKKFKDRPPLTKTLCVHQAPRGMDGQSGVFSERLGGLLPHVFEIGMGFRGNDVDLNGEPLPTAKEQEPMVCHHCGDPEHSHFFYKLPNTYGAGRDYGFLDKKH
jgi:hypothetical protein